MMKYEADSATETVVGLWPVRSFSHATKTLGGVMKL